MKKTIWLSLAALLLLPAGSLAEGLPGFEEAVQDALGAALTAYARQTPSEPAMAGPMFRETEEAGANAGTESGDLTLELSAEPGRLEEGKSLTLRVTAGNPLAQDVPVTLTLKLPERLSCAGETVWEAVLPAAGEEGPSETAFTREVTLLEGGEDETATLEAELGMGARFYRARTELALCVPKVSVSATARGTQDGRVRPGEAFAYQLEVVNRGTASREVEIEMTVPEGVCVSGELPAGVEQDGHTLRCTVLSEAAGTSAPSRISLSVPVTVEEDALEGDEDATRLLSGVLRVNGERMPMPRVQACAAQITAQLIPEADSLEVGAQMDMRIAVVNTGLMPSDVRVCCLLPEGLSPVPQEKDGATPAEAAALPPDDGAAPQAAAMLTEEAEAPEASAFEYTPENRTLIYALHMDAAQETADGVLASTRSLTVRVRADEPQSGLREKLVGASLAYDADGDMRMAEAAAVRVYTPAFLGITRDEWGGIFWAAVLLVVTVSCLYAAVRSSDDAGDLVYD